MVDLVKLTISAGDGGDGRVSFLRTKRQPKGGPDGGDGGRGASVVFLGNENVQTLRDFAGKHKIEARSGQPGGSDKKHGANPEDVHVSVPVGTTIWRVKGTERTDRSKRMYWFDDDNVRHERKLPRVMRQPTHASPSLIAEHVLDDEGNVVIKEVLREDQREKELQLGGQTLQLEWVGEVVTNGQQVVVARGGRGGRGNWTFRSSTHTTPKEAETGQPGEAAEFVLELQLLADIGLIGFPNVGKSTLLSVLTSAQPQIADYPFTTLEPNLGVLEFPPEMSDVRANVLIADIPGIIPGASEGKGLGIAFLRHIERCRGLIFVLSIDDGTLLDESNTPETLADLLITQYEALIAELSAYNTEIIQKKKIILINKSDIVEEEKRAAITRLMSSRVQDPMWISAKTNQGIDLLITKIAGITLYS